MMIAINKQGLHFSGNRFIAAPLRHTLKSVGAKNFPGHDGKLRGGLAGGSSLQKKSANLARHFSAAKKRELVSANDATIELLQESLTETGAILPVEQEAFDANVLCAKKALTDAGVFAGLMSLEHPNIITYMSSCQQDNRMIFISPQIANLGFTPEMLFDKTDWRLQHVHEDDLDRVSQALQHSRSTGEKFNCRYRLYDSRGKVRWFHDEARVLCDESAMPLFMQGAMLDITDGKEMEAELNGHRYNLEHNVEQRTGQLMKQLTVLESCNATLCDKLALIQKELAALKQQSLVTATQPAQESTPVTPTSIEQLDDISDWARKMIGWRVIASGAIA